MTHYSLLLCCLSLRPSDNGQQLSLPSIPAPFKEPAGSSFLTPSLSFLSQQFWKSFATVLLPFLPSPSSFWPSVHLRAEPAASPSHYPLSQAPLCVPSSWTPPAPPTSSDNSPSCPSSGGPVSGALSVLCLSLPLSVSPWGGSQELEKEGGRAQMVSLRDINAPHQGILINIMCHTLLTPRVSTDPAGQAPRSQLSNL